MHKEYCGCIIWFINIMLARNLSDLPLKIAFGLFYFQYEYSNVDILGNERNYLAQLEGL